MLVHVHGCASTRATEHHTAEMMLVQKLLVQMEVPQVGGTPCTLAGQAAPSRWCLLHTITGAASEPSQAATLSAA